jgi:WD40-like Beta Propeller Repeat
MTYTRLVALATVGATLGFLPPHPAPHAELFAPNVISTRDYERDGTFSPDGKTFYFTKRTIWGYFSAICVTHLQNGRWSEPEVASFSGQYPDATPSISPDGARIYFASRRPINGAPAHFFSLWVAERDARGDGWSEPHRLPDAINGKEGSIAPVETRDGSLYFVSGEAGHVVVAKKVGEGWSAPAIAGDSNATGTEELSAYVDPDQRFMIVAVIGRDDALHSAEGVYPRADLYARTRVGDGWSPLRHLDAPINSGADDLSPFVSPDGRYLYFTSERGVFTEHGEPFDYAKLEGALHAPGNGLGDIYRVNFQLTGIAR